MKKLIFNALPFPFFGMILNSCELMNQFNLVESDPLTASSIDIRSTLNDSPDYTFCSA